MSIIFVARSSSLTKWGSDVGLGKNLYLLGTADDFKAAQADLKAGVCGETDWLLAGREEMGELTLDQAIERLAKKEKMVDPVLYPRLRGLRGLFKVKPENVENHLMMIEALAGKQPEAKKLKPADIATYLLRYALPEPKAEESQP